ncbi:MAG: long-chain fatty acid--CoA ligase [Gammaproteobacteria bacterium]|nr:long-chain fatty acid--CoA ligase [Gammaproteobacteria bacterium]MBU1832968.1 long-chain fatty acid--CoA ligase [Gammaproteobacteria bacterium]
MKDLRILSNLIEDKKNSNPNLDVLTFVNVLPSGDLEHEIRTYNDLWEQGQRVFSGLRNEGMAPGESFAMVMQNHPEFVDCMVGSSLAATVFVPIDPRTNGERLEYMLSWSDCKGVVCADYCLNAVLAACKKLPQVRWIWVLHSGELIKLPAGDSRLRKWTDIAGAPLKEVEGRVRSADETMQMLYTSALPAIPKQSGRLIHAMTQSLPLGQ